MLFLYRIGIAIFSGLMKFAALWHPKARLWVNGRKHFFSRIAPQPASSPASVWFHFASLGEFEQGRPVMEALKKAEPDTPIIITFFSPSGYEIRKNYALAHAIYYLPLDTPKNAARFIQLINPKLAVFTKYEYWYFYFRELSRQQIPLYMISSIFRKDQVFFKWYGSLHRKMLGFVNHFFVQNKESVQLLNQLGFNKVSLAGDTRFDRVSELTKTSKQLPEIKAFCGNSKVFIAGSTWPEDESLLIELINAHPDWKFIIAPHEIEEAKIKLLLESIPTGKALLYSELKSWELGVGGWESKLTTPNSKLQTLVINNIGLLSSLYAYADVAYIGGGFGKGIHNTLEAAAYGIPVIFGPKYKKFQEAKDLISAGAGFSIQNQEELNAVFIQFQNETMRTMAGEKASAYVKEKIGATNIILNFLMA